MLLQIVQDLARTVSPGLRLEAFWPLTESSMRNAQRLSPGGALTGPVVRGSVETVTKHRRALNRYSGTVEDAYRALAVIALDVVMRRKQSNTKELRQLKALLKRRP